jgi:hypothetical protein
MTRGKLDKETASKIENELPQLIDLQTSTFHFQPDLISMRFPVNSSVPIASVCLQDAMATLQEARYAVFEALAHMCWHREKLDPPDDFGAAFFGKFYADDAALRLYAAAEHTANAIVNMLEIEREVRDFKKSHSLKNKNVLSLQAIVGSYLVEHHPAHPITRTIIKLKDSGNWKQVRRYRDDWVHNKPPIIEGLGIAYSRRKRLIVKEDWIGVTVGGGDGPQFSVDELVAITKSALNQLSEVVAGSVKYYVDLLNQNEKMCL